MPFVAKGAFQKEGNNELSVCTHFSDFLIQIDQSRVQTAQKSHRVHRVSGEGSPGYN